MENTIRLLTDDERFQIPFIIHRRNQFRRLVQTFIENYQNTVSNCIMIQGKPGSGKTTLVEELLTQMKENERIENYRRVPGHVTASALYGILQNTSEPNKNGMPQVLLLDDVDALDDEPCLELLKASFDTKNNLPTNRKVCYQSSTVEKKSFTFKGFGIIITNDDFSKKNLTIHQQALLDRVQTMSVDLEAGDMIVYTTYLIEKMLNDNEEHWSPEQIQSVVELFNTDVRRWISVDAFRKSGVRYSTRLIKKFVDSQKLFPDDWKLFNTDYMRIDTASQLATALQVKIDDNELLLKNGSVITRELRSVYDGHKGTMVEKLLWIDPDTNEPFIPSMQTYYNKKKDCEVGETLPTRQVNTTDGTPEAVENIG